MISIKFLNVLSVYCVIVKFKLLNVEMVAYHDTVGTTSQNDSLHEIPLSSGICLKKIILSKLRELRYINLIYQHFFW